MIWYIEHGTLTFQYLDLKYTFSRTDFVGSIVGYKLFITYNTPWWNAALCYSLYTGEHIDYSGYSVLPMAIQQDIVMAVGRNTVQKLILSNTNPKYR